MCGLRAGGMDFTELDDALRFTFSCENLIELPEAFGSQACDEVEEDDDSVL